MRVDWDVPIAMDDGLVLPASVFGGATTLHLHNSYVLIPVIP